MLRCKVLGDGNFPLVTVGKEFFLVVYQLFVCLCRKLVVRALHDGIHWARLLTESAVDTLGHVNIVLRRLTTPVLTLVRFYGDSLLFAVNVCKLINGQVWK